MQSPDALDTVKNSLWQDIINSNWAKAVRRSWQWLTLVHSSDPLQHTLNSAFANVLIVIFLANLIFIPIAAALHESLIVIVSILSVPFYILLGWLNRKGTIFGGFLVVVWMIIILVAGLSPSSYTGMDSPIPLVLIFPVLIGALFIRPQAAIWTVAALMTAFWIRLSTAGIPPENQARFLVIGTQNLGTYAAILWIGTRIFLQSLRKSIEANNALGLLNIRLKQEIQQRIEAESQLLEAQVKQLELESQKALIDFKQQFIATVSHDFRTPLTVIKTSSDLIEKYFHRLTPDQRTKTMRNMQTQVQHMIELLDEVLMIYESQSGKLAFNPVPVDIEVFCQELFAEFKVTASARHQLIFMSEIPIKTILADEKLLRHILMNLLSNAIKYSPQGGKIQFGATVQTDVTKFTVSDEGLGIDLEEVELIFEPFYRGKNSGKISGSGLGLSIVKSALETLGGTIICTSTPGKGTLFEVEIPIRRA